MQVEVFTMGGGSCGATRGAALPGVKNIGRGQQGGWHHRRESGAGLAAEGATVGLLDADILRPQPAP